MAGITIVLMYHVIWFLQMLKSVEEKKAWSCQGILWKKVYNSGKIDR